MKITTAYIAMEMAIGLPNLCEYDGYDLPTSVACGLGEAFDKISECWSWDHLHDKGYTWGEVVDGLVTIGIELIKSKTYNNQEDYEQIVKTYLMNKLTDVHLSIRSSFLPNEVMRIIDSADDETYQECERIKLELNDIGWDCEFGLDAIISQVTEKQFAILYGDGYLKDGKCVVKTETFKSIKDYGFSETIHNQICDLKLHEQMTYQDPCGVVYITRIK
jgi:hypothetical protein